MEFVKGDQVEVCSKEDGFLGSYFGATVLSKTPEGSYYKVKYKNLVTEEDESKRLIEVISVDELRPMPPKSLPVMFGVNEKVDALDKDGWWVGEVTGRKGDLFSVYFATTDEELKYPLYRLRRHLDWVNGDWVSSATRKH
ncbi:Protein AGENET DOMAIN (AGD)-CONTAINING P1 [Cardamine amara subsp. amara]|uniref:Protein AGENET DOMAIN (AGD)-CONTAINING P1 n=1 Tax=Cardamine amara subsp. amara TaxID=228776 RepID=A0ABD1A7N7_CARAN